MYEGFMIYSREFINFHRFFLFTGCTLPKRRKAMFKKLVYSYPQNDFKKVCQI